MKIISGIFLSVFFMTLVSHDSYAKDEEIYFGSVAMDIPAIMHRRLSPLIQYLSAQIKQPVSLLLSPNMNVAINKVASNQVHLAYLTPVAYLKAHEKGDAEILVKTVTNGHDSFQLMIVVKEDSLIAKVEDLKGRKFAFGDKAALLHRAVVVNAGMPLENLGSFNFIGHYDNIVRGVLNGDFDAGILKDTKALSWKDKGIRIIHSSPRLPPYNITASAKLDPELKQKLKNALLRLDIKNEKHKKIIQALSKKYTGFKATTDSDYDVVRELVAPFNK